MNFGDACLYLQSAMQNAVRGLLHRDPAAALRKALEDPPILCKDPAVKVGSDKFADTVGRNII